MNISKSVVFFGAGVTAIAGAVGFSIYKQKKFEDAIKKMSDNVKVDVSDPYVKDIVEMAVNKNVEYRINRAASEAVAAVRSDMSKKVKKEVDNAYSDIKSSVKAELKKQVGEVNIDSVRKEVIEEAKTTASEKFKSDLDDVVSSTLEKYNSNLKQINTIYSSIAQTLQPTASKGTTLTIG